MSREPATAPAAPPPTQGPPPEAADTVDTAELTTILEPLAVLILRHLSPDSELSLTAASTLSKLARSGPARLTDLATGEGVAQPSMTQLVQRLQRQGLVERRADPADGRVVQLHITDAGRQAIARRWDARADNFARLLHDLAPADQRTLLTALRTARPLVEQLNTRAAHHPHHARSPAPATRT